MALQQACRFKGKPLPMPTYKFSDVPWCATDLSGSSLFEVTKRQHFNDSIAELTLLCNEASRRSKNKGLTTSRKGSTNKPLSIEYIFDRIDTDDPLWGLMVRTDAPTSLKGRPSNVKASPHWKRGMLQGFITVTTFTNWKSSFRCDSLHEMAFAGDDDDLEEQMKNGLRKYDEDGSLAEELEATAKRGNPHVEGVVYPRIAEVALLGGLGCGKQLLRLVIEHLERLKSSARQNYDYIVLQATDNSVPFYESMGFMRVGCVQSKSPCPDECVTGPIEEYTTQKKGETCQQIAKKFGVDVWDVIFLNQPIYGSDLKHQSWLKVGTKIFVPKKVEQSKENKFAPKWYVSRENDTPRDIAKKFGVNFSDLLQANKRRYPELTGNSRLMEGTRIQIANFDIDETNTTVYSHWTFPTYSDTDPDDEEPSYMMALRLNRKKGKDALEKPVAASLSVPMNPYSPDEAGVKELLLQPNASLAPMFTQTKKLEEPPKKPKRPTTSFGHFSAEIRSNLPKEVKGKQFGEINAYIGEQWRALTDEGKLPYMKKSEESKAACADAMKKYELELANFKRSAPKDITGLRGQDTSLLEKVVKLKSNSGISGASKYDYFYVLTFIPDLQWVHLIPMVKDGEFDDEHPEISGRPKWKLVGEDAGKEIDTTAGMCVVVTARAMNDSANADDEYWDVYDKGETPPVLAALVPKAPTVAPVKPKKPASREQFVSKRRRFLKSSPDKRKKGRARKQKEGKKNKDKNTTNRTLAPIFDPITSPTPSISSSPDNNVEAPGTRKRGRPRKHPLPKDVPLPKKKKTKTDKSAKDPDQGSSNKKREGKKNKDKNTTNRPLAPIFLKSYGKKKKKAAETTAAAPPDGASCEDISPRPSRHPNRKRKCTSSSDLAAVSDVSDSVSFVEAIDQPRRLSHPVEQGSKSDLGKDKSNRSGSSHNRSRSKLSMEGSKHGSSHNRSRRNERNSKHGSSRNRSRSKLGLDEGSKHGRSHSRGFDEGSTHGRSCSRGLDIPPRQSRYPDRKRLCIVS